MVEPEGRRPRADRDVDEDVRILFAQIPSDIEQCHEVRVHAITCFVPLECVDARFAHELQASILKPFLVGG